MDEKIYKTMGSAGASTLAVGICVLAGGITAGDSSDRKWSQTVKE